MSQIADRFIFNLSRYLNFCVFQKWPDYLYIQPIYKKQQASDDSDPTVTKFTITELNEFHKKLKKFLKLFYNTEIIFLDILWIDENLFIDKERHTRKKILDGPCQQEVIQYQVDGIFNSEQIKKLKHGDQKLPRNYHGIIILTDQNLYGTRANSKAIIGQTYMLSGFAICSFAKFLKDYDEKLESYHVTILRVLTHEIGHLYSLPHCPNKTCGMQDAKSSVESLTHDLDFCERCYKKLSKMSSCKISMSKSKRSIRNIELAKMLKEDFTDCPEYKIFERAVNKLLS